MIFRAWANDYWKRSPPYEIKNILLLRIETAGKQLSKIVGKDLAGQYPCLFAKALHPGPDVASVKGLARSGTEDPPLWDPPISGIGQKLLFQLSKTIFRLRRKDVLL